MASNKQTQRILKISAKHFDRKWNDAVFPEIRLKGRWLKELGFLTGKFVAVEVIEDRLVITLLPQLETNKPVGYTLPAKKQPALILNEGENVKELRKA